MGPTLKSLGAGGGVGVLLGAPFVVHFASDGSDLAGLVVALQAGALASLMVGMAEWPVRVFVAVTSFVVVGLLWRALGAAFAVAATHAASYLALLVIFAGSLSPGHEPIVTRMARRVRGVLPEVLVRYTRGVTVLWCGFFLAQILVSASLGLAVGLGWIGAVWWRDFVTLWNIPLLLGLFVAEFAYHSWRFADLNPTGIVDVVRAARGFRGVKEG